MKLVLVAKFSGEENKKKREKKKREKKKKRRKKTGGRKGRKKEKNIYESFTFLFAPGKNIKFQCTASQKRGIRRSRFRSL